MTASLSSPTYDQRRDGVRQSNGVPRNVAMTHSGGTAPYGLAPIWVGRVVDASSLVAEMPTITATIEYRIH